MQFLLQAEQTPAAIVLVLHTIISNLREEKWLLEKDELTREWNRLLVLPKDLDPRAIAHLLPSSTEDL